MDLNKANEISDKLFDLDKSTGDLAKGIVELKDFLTSVHKDFTEKESKIQTLTEEMNVLQTRNSKLIEANGEMLLKIPVKSEKLAINNPYEKQEEPNLMQELLGGIKI